MEDLESIVKDLTKTTNNLEDNLYEINCSLQFITKATNSLMDSLNSNLNMNEDFSYGFFILMRDLETKLNNVTSSHSAEIENISDNLLAFDISNKRKILKLTESKIEKLKEEIELEHL
ncbi:hypothetical protein [Aliarcobacter lanthieri]|uniref:hypothetical protein n=1 Tax=Aliarcobacter lanthieri TaxID=1355374 RepID=UPI00047D27A2|nr:hypothetical protein [Aliarcobacter lanthieri]